MLMLMLISIVLILLGLAKHGFISLLAIGLNVLIALLDLLLALRSCLLLGGRSSAGFGDFTGLGWGLGYSGLIGTSSIGCLLAGSWGLGSLIGGTRAFTGKGSAEWKIELLLEDGDLVGDGLGVLVSKGLGNFGVVNL